MNTAGQNDSSEKIRASEAAARETWSVHGCTLVAHKHITAQDEHLTEYEQSNYSYSIGQVKAGWEYWSKSDPVDFVEPIESQLKQEPNL